MRVTTRSAKATIQTGDTDVVSLLCSARSALRLVTPISPHPHAFDWPSAVGRSSAWGVERARERSKELSFDLDKEAQIELFEACKQWQ